MLLWPFLFHITWFSIGILVSVYSMISFLFLFSCLRIFVMWLLLFSVGIIGCDVTIWIPLILRVNRSTQSLLAIRANAFEKITFHFSVDFIPHFLLYYIFCLFLSVVMFCRFIWCLFVYNVANGHMPNNS